MSFPQPVNAKALLQDKAVFFAVLAIVYGVIATLVEAVYYLIDGSSAEFALLSLFLYGWLSAFVWFGTRQAKHRAKFYLSGVIPLALIALTLLLSWPFYIPAVVLMAVALYFARLRLPDEQPRMRRQ